MITIRFAAVRPVRATLRRSPPQCALGHREWLSGPGGEAKGAYLMTGTTRSAPVLITGCSSGIGRAAAISLHDAGLTVYATARQVDSMAGLASRGIHTLALDVTDETSMTEAVTAVETAAGAI